MNGITLTQAALYCRRDMDQVEQHSFAGGMVAVYTTRCPGKESANEDAAAVIPIDETTGILLVADGLGGYRSGELASETVVSALKSSLECSAHESDSLRPGILDGIEAGNRQLCEMGIGAATTLAVVEIRQRTVRPFHVGDSEILVVGQRGKVKLQTVSHAPVALAVEAGLLDETAAIHHQDRHWVSNFVGTPAMRIEIGPELMLAPRDTLLIASDGLFDNLHHDEIVNHIRNGPLPSAVKRLADDARQRMTAPRSSRPCKPDDLTIIAFRPAAHARAVGVSPPASEERRAEPE